MPTEKTITMKEAAILPLGTRVYAKYRGAGHLVVPTHEALAEPHFDEDYFIAWDTGGHSWLGKEVLQILK